MRQHRNRPRAILAPVLLGVVATLLAVGCVPPPGTVAGSGPVGSDLVVSVRLSGAWEHAVGGRVAGGDLEILRSGSSVSGIRGEAEVPGKGAGAATVGFDLDIDAEGRAAGTVEVVDPAAGVRVLAETGAGTVDVTDGSVVGSVDGVRVWRIPEFRPYRIEWEVRDATEGDPSPAVVPPPPVAASGSFSAITYNVAGLPEPFSGSEPTRLNPLIGPLVTAHDIVLLQEDFFYPDLVAAGIDLPWASVPERLPWGSDPTRPSAIVASGLERYSTMRFSGHERHRWPGCFGLLPFDGGAADCLSQKGFSVARHTLAQGVEVDVYNLHAEAGSTPDDLYWSARQYEALADFIAGHSAGRAVLLGGDTNLHVDEAPDGAVWEKFLAATGLSDVCDLTACEEQPFSIDRFAVRSSDDLRLDITARAVPSEDFSLPDGTPLSDHDPTTVQVSWESLG